MSAYRQLTETLRDQVAERLKLGFLPATQSWSRALALLEDELEEQKRYQEAQASYSLMEEEEEVPR